MRRIGITCTLVVLTSSLADAHHEEFVPPEAFRLEDGAIGGPKPARATAAAQTSTRIAAVGDGALVIDPDSGSLLLTDGAGGKVAVLAIARDAGLLVYDDVAHVAYVADRRGDRIMAVRVGTTLELVRTWKTPAEPYGIALAPDRKTALVTAIADRLVVAYDVATGRELWRVTTAAEPRGIAISADGSHAIVASIATGVLDELALGDGHRAITHHLLPAGTDTTRARGAFAVTFLGDQLAVAAFQRETPVASESGDTGHYGGSFFPPITHHLAFVGVGSAPRSAVAETSVHLPRALAWDAQHDALYVAGLGTDQIVQVRKASQIDARAGTVAAIAGKERCGADGLAVAGDGSLLVWCSFTRSVARVRTVDGGKLAARWATTPGPVLVESSLDDEQHLGMTLFHSADPNISAFGGLACANCHMEGRADGLSWLIHGEQLQTPMLAGRIANTAPYKWDGGAKDLPTSLRATIDRLGGDGLSKKHIAALASYLEHMPAVRTPTVDRTAVLRGKQVFETAGCANCHDGPAYTDQATHKLARRQGTFDTPSLVGISASAPYFHDGSAATLAVVLRDQGMVHGMSETAMHLTDAQVADLTAFLSSL